MKVALVNLCKIENIGLWNSFKSDVNFLNENNIVYVDYASERDTEELLLQGFYDALNDETVELIWFVQGGATLLSFIDKIDWDKVVSSKKKFMGLSDFTHFAILAVSKGVTCYYGLALKNIKKYFSESKLLDIANFIKSVLDQNELICHDEKYLNFLQNMKITGGHLTSLIYMIEHYKIVIKDYVLFIEHHYIPGENLNDLKYYLDQLTITLKENKPIEIILGHSILFDDQNNEIDYKKLNIFMREKLAALNVPITEIDHFIKPILLG